MATKKKYQVIFEDRDEPVSSVRVLGEFTTAKEARKFLQQKLNASTYTKIDTGITSVTAGYDLHELHYMYSIYDPSGKQITINEEKPAKEEPLHVTVHIGKFTLYRRMSCEALHKYVHSIVAKGYKLYRRLDGNGIGRIDESKICEAFFANGIALRKEDKMIVLEQTPKSKWK